MAVVDIWLHVLVLFCSYLCICIFHSDDLEDYGVFNCYCIFALCTTIFVQCLLDRWYCLGCRQNEDKNALHGWKRNHYACRTTVNRICQGKQLFVLIFVNEANPYFLLEHWCPLFRNLSRSFRMQWQSPNHYRLPEQ